MKMRKRLSIIKSLQHIGATFKSEWRTLVKICWLPLLALLLLLPLLYFSQHNWGRYVPLKEVGWRQYSAQIRAILLPIFSALSMAGVYRYLLHDPRFHIRTITLKRGIETSRPVISIPLYFDIDKSIILLALFFAGWRWFYMHAVGLAAYVILPYTSVSSNDILLFYLWELFLFFLVSQLCLVFPYIAVSRNPAFRKALKNIWVLKGNRLRVWAVQSIIVVCGMSIASLPSLILYTLNRYAGLYSDSSIITLAFMADIVFWFLTLLFSAIFCAAVFKDIGVREETLATA